MLIYELLGVYPIMHNLNEENHWEIAYNLINWLIQNQDILSSPALKWYWGIKLSVDRDDFTFLYNE